MRIQAHNSIRTRCRARAGASQAAVAAFSRNAVVQTTVPSTDSPVSEFNMTWQTASWASRNAETQLSGKFRRDRWNNQPTKPRKQKIIAKKTHSPMAIADRKTLEIIHQLVHGESRPRNVLNQTASQIIVVFVCVLSVKFVMKTWNNKMNAGM